MQRAARGPNRSPLTVPMPPTRPSAGVLAIRSASSRRRRWAAITSGPYSTNEPSSTRSATFSRAVRRPRWRGAGRRRRGGPRRARRGGARSTRRGRRGRRRRAASSGAPSSGACRRGIVGDRFEHARAGRRASRPCPTPTSSSATRPRSVAATSWCIFIDSMSISTAPAPHDVAGRHLQRHDRPLQRAADLDRTVRHPRSVSCDAARSAGSPDRRRQSGRRALDGSTRPCARGPRAAGSSAPSRAACGPA